MHPLDGPPALAYDYLVNIADTLVLRRLPTLVLALLAALAAAATIHLLGGGRAGT